MNAATQPTASLSQVYQSRYSELTTHLDGKYQTMWCYMHSTPRPCFTPRLLHDIRQFQEEVARLADNPTGSSIRYLVLASDVPGAFNLGGDLDLFRKLIASRDRQGLFRYAKSCIDVLYPNLCGLERDLTTVSLVQGDALGGGFEAAMSSQVLIAERRARFGLPEVLFNLFPGMGAYSILSRKIGEAKAERMILSGKIYSAEELHEMGIIDVLAEDGQGEMAVYEHVRQRGRSWNGVQALRQAKRFSNPITYEELISITKVWVDAAMRLEDRDLRMMERLVSRQTVKARAA
jgi:DSF synthase